MEKDEDDPYTDGLKKIAPSICVISVGKDNDHGHPHDKAMEIYKNESDYVYLTKDEDAESIVVDIETLDVEILEKKDLVSVIARHLLDDSKPVVEVSHSISNIESSCPENYCKIDNKKVKVSKNGSLYFRVANPKIGSEYKWKVRNNGRAVQQYWRQYRQPAALENESMGMETRRDLKWKGRHTMTCQEIRNGNVIAESLVKVVIK